MTTAAYPLQKISLQQTRACLGICRHCYGGTTSVQPCHAELPDIILALEIAVELLKMDSKLAHGQLCDCAERCVAGANRWERSRHPRCRQSALACRAFAGYWKTRASRWVG